MGASIRKQVKLVKQAGVLGKSADIGSRYGADDGFRQVRQFAVSQFRGSVQHSVGLYLGGSLGIDQLSPPQNLVTYIPKLFF